MWVIAMLILIPLIIWFIFESGMPMVVVFVLAIFSFPLLVLISSITRKWVSDNSYDVTPQERELKQKQREHNIARVKAQEKYDNDWGYIR